MYRAERRPPKFLVACEERISQQRTFESGTNDIKSELVYAVTERKNPCTRCSQEFTQSHLTVCKAKAKDVEIVLQSVTLRECANVP